MFGVCVLASLWGCLQLVDQNPSNLVWAYQELAQSVSAEAAKSLEEKALCPYQDRLGILRLEAAHSHVSHQIKKTHFP